MQFDPAPVYLQVTTRLCWQRLFNLMQLRLPLQRHLLQIVELFLFRRRHRLRKSVIKQDNPKLSSVCYSYNNYYSI